MPPTEVIHSGLIKATIVLAASFACCILTFAYFDERADRKRIEQAINNTRPSDVLAEIREWRKTDFTVRPSDVLKEVKSLEDTLEKRTNDRLRRSEFETFLKLNPNLKRPEGY